MPLNKLLNLRRGIFIVQLNVSKYTEIYLTVFKCLYKYANYFLRSYTIILPSEVFAFQDDFVLAIVRSV